MAVKRGREEDAQTLDLVSCLMMLSKSDQHDHSTQLKKPKTVKSSERVFACQTCNREFSSFQALGGHRSSHNKPKPLTGAGATDLLHISRADSPAKTKAHECPICGVEFALGQALGGHMRRHRAIMATEKIPVVVPVLKKSNSSKRLSCLNLDLNLAPPGEQRHYDLTKLRLIV